MCDCFANADVEVENIPPRYPGDSSVKRMSLVRDKPLTTTYRRSNEVMIYSPRSTSSSFNSYNRPLYNDRYADTYYNGDRYADSYEPRRYGIGLINPNRKFIPLPTSLREQEEDDAQVVRPLPVHGRRGRSRDTGVVVVHGGGGRRRRRARDDYNYSDGYSDDSWNRGNARYSFEGESEDSWNDHRGGLGRAARRRGRSQSRDYY